ncbi:hypothetical protein BsWGS_12066 [Bradybaena similaris]
MRLLLLICTLLEPTLSVHEQKSPVMFAVLLPDDNIRPFSMRKVLPAIQIAVEKVRSPSGLLPGFEIEINYADSKCSGADAMNEAINFYVRNKSHLFLGPCCDYAAAPIGRQTKYWDTPMITTAIARDFTIEKISKYPMVTRVWATINKMAEFFSILFNEFSWRQVKIIYEPKGLDMYLEHMCHVTAESLHFVLTDTYDLNVPYYKFESTLEILGKMEEQIGLKDASEYLGVVPVNLKFFFLCSYCCHLFSKC